MILKFSHGLAMYKCNCLNETYAKSWSLQMDDAMPASNVSYLVEPMPILQSLRIHGNPVPLFLLFLFCCFLLHFCSIEMFTMVESQLDPSTELFQIIRIGYRIKPIKSSSCHPCLKWQKSTK